MHGWSKLICSQSRPFSAALFGGPPFSPVRGDGCADMDGLNVQHGHATFASACGPPVQAPQYHPSPRRRQVRLRRCWPACTALAARPPAPGDPRAPLFHPNRRHLCRLDAPVHSLSRQAANPRELGASEVTAFLTHLAVDRTVAASTQNQAKSALLFLYREVLGVQLPWLDEIVGAETARRLPVVLTPCCSRATRHPHGACQRSA